jgi:hypothetical protein
LNTHARACLLRIGNHRPSPTAECSTLSNSCPLGRIDRSICVPVAWRRRRRGAAGERGGCGDIGTLWPQTEHTSQHRRRNVEVWTVEVQPRVVPSNISQRQVLRHLDGNARVVLLEGVQFGTSQRETEFLACFYVVASV